MHPVSADPARPSSHPRFFLTLSRFADEVCGTLARLISYVGALALIGILLIAFWQQIGNAAPESVLKLADDFDRTETYAVFRRAAPAGWPVDRVTSGDNPRLRGAL